MPKMTGYVTTFEVKGEIKKVKNNKLMSVLMDDQKLFKT